MKNIVQSGSKRTNIVLFLLAFAVILSVFICLVFPFEKKGDLVLKESEKVSPPVFSFSSGFYASSFDLQISSSEKDGRIVYTLDGSVPSENSIAYSGPITINSKESEENVISEIPTSPRWQPPVKRVNKCSVVRAAVISKDGQISKTITNSYFVSDKKRMGYTLPVISLVSDHSNLFDRKGGIYVMGQTYEDKDNYIYKNIPLDLPWWRYPANYNNHGKKSFRPVVVEFFDVENGKSFSVQSELRISGNDTRGYSQKSLSVYFYGAKSKEHFFYPLFKNDSLGEFRSIVLKNAGNDWDKAFMRDAFVENMLHAAGYDAPAYRSVVVFLNGEYWGVHHMSERMNADYLAIKYDLDLSKIKVARYLEGTVFGNKFDDQEYMNLLQFVKENKVSVPENYEVVKSKMDIDNFLDYVIAEIFFANTDWPHNNFLFWRYVKPLNDSTPIAEADGRFRWMITDFDCSYGYNGSVDVNMLPKAMQDYLFRKLISNSEFRQLFLERFQQHLNTTFVSGKALAQIDSLETVLYPEMQQQIDRWRVLGSIDKWRSNIEVMRDFADQRPSIMAAQLNAFFKLKGANQISVKKQ